MRNTITEDKLANTFASGDKMTGDEPTARTGLALCHSVILDSVAHWWVPARTPTVHQCFHGGRPWVAHNKLHAQHRNDKTKVIAPRLGYQHGGGVGLLKPQIFEAATELGDKNTFTSPPQIQERPNRNPLSQILSRYRKCSLSRFSRHRHGPRDSAINEQTVADPKTYERI